MNLEQIALRVALDLDPEMRADDDPGQLYEFCRRLVAALGAQEPEQHFRYKFLDRAALDAWIATNAAPPICPTCTQMIDEAARQGRIVDDRWQPIETAPQDGTHVLLYFPELKKRGNEEVVIGFWHQPGNPSHPGFWMGWGSGRKTATHWMPLPATPEYKKP